MATGACELVAANGAQPEAERAMEILIQDFRYGVRVLRKSPAFSAAAILSLALGVGANIAIFQLLNAVLLRTLPASNPHELAEVRPAGRNSVAAVFSGSCPHFTYPMWEQFRQNQQAFSGTFAWSSTRFNLAFGGEARYAQGLWVSGDFFDVLNVRPVLGRLISDADDRRGCGSPVAVISYAFWQREYGGDASAAGQQLMLDGKAFTVIGVTPESFHGVEVGRAFDVAIPICAEPLLRGEGNFLSRRDCWWLAVVGRLKPGWSNAQASAYVASISPGLFEETVPAGYDASNLEKYRALRLGAFPIATGFSPLRDEYQEALLLLLGIAGLVLLVACTNIANLMLARASGREREMSVRLALGASRSRLVRQLLGESLLVAGAGAALGFLLAQYVSQFLVAFLSTQDNPLFVDLTIDWRVLAFVAGLAIATCLLFGLAPALRASGTTPGTVLKASGRGMTAMRGRFGLKRLLVVSQIALSLVLVVVALSFTRSLRNLLNIDPGFRPDGVLITDVDLGRLRLSDERLQSFKLELLERLRSAPGVRLAADTTIVPLGGSSWTLGVRAGAHQDQRGSSKFTWISPTYFQTIGTTLVTGRDFSDRDTRRSTRVAIVNESFARQLLKGADPIGQTFRTVAEPNYPETLYEIVGVVKDTKYSDLRGDAPPIAYGPTSQDPAPSDGDHIIVRSTASLSDAMLSTKTLLGSINPEIGIQFRVFKSMIRNSIIGDRLMATLSGFFGFLAVLLATLGLYGVISYMVAQRRNEIGIRMALGADRRGIVMMIIREAGVLLLVGVVIGATLSFVAARGASAMLYGLQVNDPVTFVMAVALLAGVSTAASYVPARRASRIDPMVALRDE